MSGVIFFFNKGNYNFETERKEGILVIKTVKKSGFTNKGFPSFSYFLNT